MKRINHKIIQINHSSSSVYIGSHGFNIPRNINGYIYSKLLDTENNDDRIVCLYKNSDGEKAIAKIWYGKYRNEGYKFLKNEFISYASINMVMRKIKLPNHLNHIRIPKLIKYLELENICILLIEHIEGIDIKSLDDNQIVSNFKDLSNFMEYVDANMTEKDKLKFKRRNGIQYLLFYVYTIIMSIIRYPRYSNSIIRGFLFVIKHIKYLINVKKLKFVHGDLNINNYIVDIKGNIYLIDFEFSKITLKEFEQVSLLRYCKIHNKLYKEFRKEFYPHDKSSNQNILLRSLSIIYATQGLISTNSSNLEISSIYDFLKDSL